MKTKRFILLIPFLSVLFSLQAQQFRVQESLGFESKILNQEIKYATVLPEGYFESKKSYPVLYLLHGLGDNEISWLEYGHVVQYLDHMVKKKSIEPFICIMPQGFRSYYSDFYDGSFSYQQMFVKELVPFIDSQYRTLPSAGKRAVIGYSMGGFGALMLPLKHPDIFSVSIPLSASIRTDVQYISEDQNGWNEQWGKIFGGVNEIGKSRITDYYMQNSPFYLIKNKSSEELKKIAFFIENGDKENTLCRSNEELHMLLLEKQVPHIYNIKAGGHEFRFWRDALPEAFRFADAQFRGKIYTPEAKTEKQVYSFPKTLVTEQKSIGDKTFRIIYPEKQQTISRSYPTIYFISDLNEKKQNTLINKYEKEFSNGKLPAVLFCFVPVKYGSSLLNEIIPYMEKGGKARSGRQFRAIWGYENGGADVLKQAFETDIFTACALTEANLSASQTEIENLITQKKSLRNQIWLYVDTQPASDAYIGNGFLHINLREQGFTHEYRVRTDVSNYNFLLSGFMSALTYVCQKFHY